MRLDMNIFQIAAKYATNLMGIATPEEREALENWKQESVWHTNLAERIRKKILKQTSSCWNVFLLQRPGKKWRRIWIRLWEDVPGRGGGGNMLLSF